MSLLTHDQLPYNASLRSGRDAERESLQLIVLRLTLVLMLLHGAASPVFEIPFRIICGAMLVWPRLVHEGLLWWLLVTAMSLGVVNRWYYTDNHKFLMTYWCLACALAVQQGKVMALGRTARHLIALTFAFAVTWKIIAGQYIDGTFLYYTFLVDSRLQAVGAAISGWSIAEARELRSAVFFLGTAGRPLVNVPIDGAAQLQTATLGLSWLALVVESVVAGAYLSSSDRFYQLRHFSIMAFSAFTYYLMPVLGFATLLLILGLSQSRADDFRMQRRYFVVLAVMQLITLPWRDALSASALLAR